MKKGLYISYTAIHEVGLRYWEEYYRKYLLKFGQKKRQIDLEYSFDAFLFTIGKNSNILKTI